MGGGGNDEREQTLNQILTEMDGFEGNSGVIVVDAALLRPGRFDRRVPVGLPDKDGRREILKVHARGKPLAENCDLDLIAGRTIGMSGASLQNLMNEAAIYAARKELDEISITEVEEAIDRATVGLTKRTGTTIQSRQRLVAYHEAGHAVMGALTPDHDVVAKITILPRTNGAGGFTAFTPTEDRMDGGMYSLRYLKGQLKVALGGRMAEEIAFGKDEVSTGASNDLQQVRNISRRMVTQWGFAADEVGMNAWEGDNGGGMMGSGRASEEKEAAIDAAVERITKEAYESTKEIMLKHRDLLDAVTERLIEVETLDGFEFARIVEQYTGIRGPMLERIPIPVQNELEAAMKEVQKQ